MLEPAQLALRPAYLHPLLDVQLVEGERRDPRRRQRRADIGPELRQRTTPVLSAFGAIVSRTRLAPFCASQRVLSSGIVARHPLQRTVRAQRYATVGVFTQRGFRGSFR